MAIKYAREADAESSDQLLLRAGRIAREAQSKLTEAAGAADEETKTRALTAYARLASEAARLRSQAAGETWGDPAERREPLSYSRSATIPRSLVDGAARSRIRAQIATGSPARCQRGEAAKPEESDEEKAAKAQRLRSKADRLYSRVAAEPEKKSRLISIAALLRQAADQLESGDGPLQYGADGPKVGKYDDAQSIGNRYQEPKRDDDDSGGGFGEEAGEEAGGEAAAGAAAAEGEELALGLLL